MEMELIFISEISQLAPELSAWLLVLTEARGFRSVRSSVCSVLYKNMRISLERWITLLCLLVIWHQCPKVCIFSSAILLGFANHGPIWSCHWLSVPSVGWDVKEPAGDILVQVWVLCRRAATLSGQGLDHSTSGWTNPSTLCSCWSHWLLYLKLNNDSLMGLKLGNFLKTDAGCNKESMADRGLLATIAFAPATLSGSAPRASTFCAASQKVLGDVEITHAETREVKTSFCVTIPSHASATALGMAWGHGCLLVSWYPGLLL